MDGKIFHRLCDRATTGMFLGRDQYIGSMDENGNDDAVEKLRM